MDLNLILITFLFYSVDGDIICTKGDSCLDKMTVVITKLLPFRESHNKMTFIYSMMRDGKGLVVVMTFTVVVF